MAELPVIVRIRGSKDDSWNATIGQVKGDVRRLTADVVDWGSKASLAFGAGGAGIGALGMAALRTAGQFEQMGAKLNALLKDGEAAQQALAEAAALAASTPFSVEGVVNATVQLTAYGQRARAILPQVANLAAAMGTSIEEASLAVGKAASGSSEGFQSLRDTFGLTTLELKKMGVELNDSGGPLLRTSEQIEVARSAMLRLIDLKFGGSAVAQSATFEGAMSNLGDSVQLALNKIGQSLLPLGTMLARFTADTVARFQAIPGPVVTAGVAVGGFAAAALTFVSAATLAAAAIVSWYTALEVSAASSAAAQRALGFLAARYDAVSGAAGRMSAAAVTAGTSLRFLTGAVAIGAGAYFAGYLAIEAFEAAQKKAGAAVDEASKRLVAATNRWRMYRDAINEATAGSGVMIDRGARLGETADQIREAFARSAPATLVTSFEKAGLTLDDVRRAVGAVGDELDAAQAKWKKAAEFANRIPDAVNPQSVVQVAGSGLAEFFPGRTSATVEEIRQKVAQLRAEMADLGRTKEAVTQTLGAFERFAAPLQAAIKHAARLDTFLQFSKSSKDLQTLQTRLTETTDEVGRLAAAAQQQGLPTEVAALQRDLLTATGTRAEFVKSFLGVLAAQADAERELAEVTQKAEQEKVAAIERSQSQRRAVSGSSTAQEKADAEERLAAVTGSIAKEAALLQELTEQRRASTAQTGPAGVQPRLRQLELELEGVRKLADEEVKARTAVRDATKRLGEEQVAIARESIQAQVDSARELTADLKGGQDATAVSGQLAEILSGLDRWQQKNQSLVASSREVKRALDEARQAVEGQQAQMRERVQAARLEKITAKVSLEVTDAADTIDKLNAVRGAITQLASERKRGLLDAVAAEKALTELQRQELALNKQNNAEIASKAQTLANLTQSSLEKELEHLRVRAEAGEDVANVLKAKEEELLAAKVAAIEAAAEADRAANKDREVVEAERSAKLRALLLDETNAKIQANKQANDAVTADNKARGASSGQSTGLVPGMFVSPEAYSSGIGTSGFSQGRQIQRRSRVSMPTPAQVASQMGITQGAQARFDKLTAAGFQVAAPVAGDDARGMRQGINDRRQAELDKKRQQPVVNDNRQITVQMNLEGGSIETAIASPALKGAVFSWIDQKFRDEGHRDGGASWA